MTHARASLESTLDAVRADVDCEVFVRWTRRLHVEIEQGGTRVTHGVDEGTAIRLRTQEGDLRFGAASGSGADAAARAIATARALPATRPTHQGVAWAEGGNLVDLDGPGELPDASQAGAWLRRAWKAADAPGARAHLDAAVATEALGTGGGLRACRVRGVVWARFLEGGTVRSAVARRLDTLDPADWEEPGLAPGPAPLEPPGGAVALLPAAVAALAPAIVAVVHRLPAAGQTVGPAWLCEDDASDPGAPGGGRFDDTGFPSGRLALADGRRILASPRGPGRRRRLSFRSPPVERAANLRFSSTGSWNGNGLLARAARVQLGDGKNWWTVLQAAPAREGRLLAPWSSWVVRAGPEAWVAGCRAGVGPVRRTPEGVTCPTLVFEGLPAPVPVG